MKIQTIISIDTNLFEHLTANETDVKDLYSNDLFYSMSKELKEKFKDQIIINTQRENIVSFKCTLHVLTEEEMESLLKQANGESNKN